MDRLDAIRLFVRVVEGGSFAAAAREAGVGQPAVSKQIAALERRLGAQLMHRTSRRMALTDAGQLFYEAGVRLVEDMEAAEALVGRGLSAPSGLVRVTAPPAFGRLCIVPQLPAFFARYPDISVELTSTERTVDLIEEGMDLAIHTGPLADSSMTVRRIGATPIVTVASPAYLEAHGAPASPGELERHACVIYAPGREPRGWTYRGRSGPIAHLPRGNFRTTDAEQIRAAALAGLGVAHAPGWLFERDLACGALERLLADFEPDPLAISAVHPGGRRLATKVRVLIDFLAEVLAARG